MEKLSRARADVLAVCSNPAIGEETKQVALASADETRAAIASAAAALPGWSATPAAKRAQVMFKFRDLLMTNHDAIAEAISAEHGKTFDDAKGEVARGIEVVEFVCGIPHLMKGEYSDNVASGVDSVGIRAAGRCLRRYHSIQLPCYGAYVDVPRGLGMWQYFHPQTFRA